MFDGILKSQYTAVFRYRGLTNCSRRPASPNKLRRAPAFEPSMRAYYDSWESSIHSRARVRRLQLPELRWLKRSPKRGVPATRRKALHEERVLTE
jgi:hypothetical protein